MYFPGGAGDMRYRWIVGRDAGLNGVRHGIDRTYATTRPVVDLETRMKLDGAWNETFEQTIRIRCWKWTKARATSRASRRPERPRQRARVSNARSLISKLAINDSLLLRKHQRDKDTGEENRVDRRPELELREGDKEGERGESEGKKAEKLASKTREGGSRGTRTRRRTNGGSLSSRGSATGMQCGLCAVVAGLFRRAMCIAGSRRGSGESCYQEITTEAQTRRHSQIAPIGTGLKAAEIAEHVKEAVETQELSVMNNVIEFQRSMGNGAVQACKRMWGKIWNELSSETFA
ncbi:hypothetical protein WN48_04767 [Eufriesea mexicana]|uniref:Uncharacterized protein n=1 Tax=Eufriesea mexicana TaxID=516756 RepID=A0A310SN60_9HYME|nr:hypothetical protein WN48_04767 [Eufriesea mexicana]